MAVVVFLYVICMCFMLSDVKAGNGSEPRLADPGTQLSIDIALGRKRKIESAAPNEDSDDESALAPPSNDIYRQRQQKKVK